MIKRFQGNKHLNCLTTKIPAIYTLRTSVTIQHSARCDRRKNWVFSNIATRKSNPENKKKKKIVTMCRQSKSIKVQKHFNKKHRVYSRLFRIVDGREVHGQLSNKNFPKNIFLSHSLWLDIYCLRIKSVNFVCIEGFVRTLGAKSSCPMSSLVTGYLRESRIIRKPDNPSMFNRWYSAYKLCVQSTVSYKM